MPSARQSVVSLGEATIGADPGPTSVPMAAWWAGVTGPSGRALCTWPFRAVRACPERGVVRPREVHRGRAPVSLHGVPGKLKRRVPLDPNPNSRRTIAISTASQLRTAPSAMDRWRYLHGQSSECTDKTEDLQPLGYRGPLRLGGPPTSDPYRRWRFGEGGIVPPYSRRVPPFGSRPH